MRSGIGGCVLQWTLPIAQAAARDEAVGFDLGLKRPGHDERWGETGDGTLLPTTSSHKIALAQRRGHKRQAKRLHRTAARRRKNALHQFSRRMVDRYQTIAVGDVSAPQLAQTRMAKSVMDSGWGMLKAQLQYKGQQAGRCVRIVSERYTTQACSGCGALTGPAGLDMLAVRTWMCSGCGVTHDRDVNAARNILSAGRCPPSVSGNERSSSAAPTGQADLPMSESGKSALKKAA